MLVVNKPNIIREGKAFNEYLDSIQKCTIVSRMRYDPSWSRAPHALVTRIQRFVAKTRVAKER